MTYMCMFCHPEGSCPIHKLSALYWFSWISCVFKESRRKDEKFPGDYLIRSQNPSSSKVGHIYGSLRAALLGFLLHSTVEHIKRRAIIWIGCHVFAPIETFTTQSTVTSFSPNEVTFLSSVRFIFRFDVHLTELWNFGYNLLGAEMTLLCQTSVAF